MPIPIANMPKIELTWPPRISTPATTAASSSTAATDISIEPIKSTHSMPAAMTRLIELFLSMVT